MKKLLFVLPLVLLSACAGTNLLSTVENVASTSLKDVELAENAFQTITQTFTPSDIQGYLQAFGVSASSAASIAAGYQKAVAVNGVASAITQTTASLLAAEEQALSK